MTEERETLTVDDLDRVFIRAQDEHGNWGSISVKYCTDKQFSIWAHSRRTIVENFEDEPWTPEERAHFCNELWQAGALAILKKDTEL